MERGQQTLMDFLSTAHANGTLTADDIIACVIPLFKGVLTLHEDGKVWNILDEQAILVNQHQLFINPAAAILPTVAPEQLSRFDEVDLEHLEVAEKYARAEKQGEEQQQVLENTRIHLAPLETLDRAAYLPGFASFELHLGHHDTRSDIFSLGLILASLSLALNLYDADDLTTFVNNRKRLLELQPRLHPAIISLIIEMTELQPEKRIADLKEVIYRLENFRDFSSGNAAELSPPNGWFKTVNTTRESYILRKLRNRLFDTSRRNRLLYYKSNLRFVNLTLSSVPMVVHVKSISAHTLFTWNEHLAPRLLQKKELVLNQYLRFEDHPYLPNSLNAIRIECQRDIQEYGCSQLKIAIAFLDWFNIKSEDRDAIKSPLLLLPVSLKKKKHVAEDQYLLTVQRTTAEVNPVLANYLNELYGIQLPTHVELDDTSLYQFYELIRQQLEGNNKGIVLSYQEKPKINLVLESAQRTVAQYSRRFGYQTPQLKASSKAAKLELFELAETATNIYHWQFDTCHIVLGNFNYKKMSLVRDYNQISEDKIKHEVFDQLFSPLPKPLTTKEQTVPAPKEWMHVVTTDPTQAKAINRSRDGESYVIQGPPGTGKSQTITNLIADFISRDKHILFVCEKRAALDVVYHRLKQQGLDELCCYIHDSQADKKSFIKNLEQTYKTYTSDVLDEHSLQVKRAAVLHTMEQQLEYLQEYHETQLVVPGYASTSTRDLLDALIALRPSLQPLSPKQEEAMPHYQDWVQFGHIIQQLGEVLEDSGSAPIFAEHPLAKLNEDIFAHAQPIAELEKRLGLAKVTLNKVLLALRDLQVDEQYLDSIDNLKELVMNATLMLPLAEHKAIAIIDPQSTAAKEFQQQLDQLKLQQENLAAIQETNKSWIQKIDENTAREALKIAEAKEHSMLSFLDGKWRRIKQLIQNNYNFEGQSLRPDSSLILQQLIHEYEAEKSLNTVKQTLHEAYGFQSPEMMLLTLDRLRMRLHHPVTQYLVHHPDGNQLTLRLSLLQPDVNQMEDQLRACLQQVEGKSILQIEDELENIAMNIGTLPDLLPAMENYLKMPGKLKSAIGTIPFTPRQFEAGMAHKSLKQVYQDHKQFAAADSQSLNKSITTLHQAYESLLQVNANLIRAQVRKKFNEHLQLSAQSTTTLSDAQREFKRHYLEGRKILENEFSKSMRYKSIRELASKESGAVLKDLKPVWLMSPLSVSDSLPIDTQFFDAVIFDEASQIRLEEGIPALFRAPQCIIVGDDKQMPPTDFFSSKGIDKDDLDIAQEDSWQDILSHDTESLLAQAAHKMQKVMLGWHYRSQYETLINFSNHAFYNGELLTVPDRAVHHQPKEPIVANSAAEGLLHAGALYDRSISFHFQQGAVYEKQANQREAQYIAELVRSLLRKQVKESIGIVAFSQQQQSAIESALDALAKIDPAFDDQLDEARLRVENDQFTGLFVKNLENVQGDERDIIIISICFAKAANGKMSMNFGPINKKGGEKRLNVIFSRAKKHIAVISSIRHEQITNDFNAGANYLKRFLHYAESISLGQMSIANQILGKVHTQAANGGFPGHNIILQQINHHLQQLGYVTQSQVGQSGFKCSLAIKAAETDQQYALAIMIDDEQHYQHPDVMELYYQRPALMESFGWRTMLVLAKDWLHQPKQVMDNILHHLHNDPSYKPGDTHTEAALSNSISLGVYENLDFTRYILEQAPHSFYWEIAVEAQKVITRSGKAGTKGQVQVKTMPSPGEANQYQYQLIQLKLSEGYQPAAFQQH